MGLLGILFFLGWSWWEDRKEAKMLQMEQKENTFVYGTKETYVTIQHQSLCQDDEEFLRHVRALSKPDLKESEFLDILGNFKAFLKIHRHANYQDVAMAYQCLYEYESAFHWISVSQAFWILHPWKTMIPYIPTEIYASDSEEGLEAEEAEATATAIATETATAEFETTPSPLQA